MTATPQKLKIALVDMNDGHPNQAIRSFKTLIRGLFERARLENPDLEAELIHVQPRNLEEVPPDDCDLYVCSGGPDSPVDGFEEKWCPAIRKFFDGVHGKWQSGREDAPGALAICYSFEMATMHFGVAEMAPREKRFGIMPAYTTAAGEESNLLGAFGERLFAWEHRYWNAVNLDEARLKELGGAVYARESRDGVSKGEGLTSFRFTEGIEGTIFHPEADRAGALHWIQKPEQAEAVIEAYGKTTYDRMLKTLDDPNRLARTYALLIPNWLNTSFNRLAPHRSWNEIPPVDYGVSMQAFAEAG